MPAIITHGIFAHEALVTIDRKRISTKEEQAAFVIGNQGPDPFFFCVFGARAQSCDLFGKALHRELMGKAFDAYRESINLFSTDDERKIAQAYALGLLGHYILDRTCHPLVYAQQFALTCANDELTDAQGPLHAVLESDIDMAILQRMRPGAGIGEEYPHGLLDASARTLAIAGKMHAFVARSVFGIKLDQHDFEVAFKRMRLIYRLVDTANGKRQRIFGNIERLTRKHSLMQAIAHRPHVKPHPGCVNATQKEWINPFTQTCSTASFYELFDHALSSYPTAFYAFVSGKNMLEVTKGKNYSGRQISADERCDIDD